ncbi:unnamed protein product [Brassica napus]|uniref:(rape) hypothetical protein n=1 Tax=Brassica napus TaxID=3708 RepID=A0A816JUP0_BRANA|nr:unnamed protein product [Brassica napus]
MILPSLSLLYLVDISTLSRKLLCKSQLHSCKDRCLVCNSYFFLYVTMVIWAFSIICCIFVH